MEQLTLTRFHFWNFCGSGSETVKQTAVSTHTNSRIDDVAINRPAVASW